jgi:hypothetical protein
MSTSTDTSLVGFVEALLNNGYPDTDQTTLHDDAKLEQIKSELLELTPITLVELVRTESVEVNESGGKQSYTPARFDLLPPEAVTRVSMVLGQGAKKYGEENWRLISTGDHINHALQHLFAFLQTGELEDLTHAACRTLFAVETYLDDEE